MWSVNTLAIDPACTSYSGNSPGFLSIDAHSNIIVDAAFSPDGSAIATASHDGKCKFFQVILLLILCFFNWIKKLIFNKSFFPNSLN